MGRRLGQHFLFDPTILDRIVDALDPTPADTVLEVGPGKGTLTARLAPRVGRVVAIEKDRGLAQSVRRTQGEGQGSDVRIIAGDALDIDWHELVSTEPAPSALRPPTFKVVGNIPYAITSPLIDKALTPPMPERIVFLVQKEVADRLSASAGTRAYGALTVGVQTAARVERLFVVRAGAFRPSPEVDSAVVRLTPHAEPAVTRVQAADFRSFVTALFGQRRKQIARSLRTATGLEKGAVHSVLAQVGVEPTDRVEVLTPQTLVALHSRILSLTG